VIFGALAGARRPARRYYLDPLDQQIELLRAPSALRLEPPRPVFQPGDHIRVRCWFGPIPYYHQGIVSWDANSVIHYDSGMEEGGILFIKQRKRSAAVRQTTLDRFAGSAGLEAIELVERPYDAQNVLTRAYSALGSELWAEGTYTPALQQLRTFCAVVRRRVRLQPAGRDLLHRAKRHQRRRERAGLPALWQRDRPCRYGFGLGSLLPGLGWLLLGAGIVYSGYELAEGLGFFCNGDRAEIAGSDIRRVALAQGVQFA
jgi:hypothetical protein